MHAIDRFERNAESFGHQRVDLSGRLARHRLKRNFRPPAERDDRATLFREPPKHRARLSRDVEIVG